MIEFDGVIGLITLALWLFCIIDVITTDDGSVRNLPKMVWLLLVIILPLVGSIAWLVAGRPQSSAAGLPYKGNRGFAARGHATPDHKGYGARPTASAASATPSATNPDDDAEFQAALRRRVDEQRRRAKGEGGQASN